MEFHDRRSFLSYFSAVGLSSTLLPGVLWAKLQDSRQPKITTSMLKDAAATAGLEFTDAERVAMLDGVNQNFARYEGLRKIKLDNSVAPPLHFDPIVPGMKINRTKRPFRMSKPPAVERPRNLDQVAFWPIMHLAQLIRTKQVKSVELTEMYLSRLKKYNPKLNCVVTFTDDLAMRQARTADDEISKGRYKGPLHGVPWGCKDIIAVAGYPTTWGSPLYKTQQFDDDATVVHRLNQSGAVLLAKLTTGELALNDRWFGGQTMNPWNIAQGSSGSSAGSAAATSAGLVGFALGTETRGSITLPSIRCGVVGFKPTFGRVSRNGVMAINWTLDRVGAICRAVEDCALVLKVICGPDGVDRAVSDIPFNWDAGVDAIRLRVGVVHPTSDVGVEAKENYAAALKVIEKIGCKTTELRMPVYRADDLIAILRADDAAAFDEVTRTHQDNQLLNQGPSDRPNAFRTARSIPAVEYLQANRVRALLMKDVARQIQDIDAYITPIVEGVPLYSSIQHLTGQPVVIVKSGFQTDGTPMSIAIVGKPYGETEMLALAKAYQDRTEWHLKQPPMFV